MTDDLAILRTELTTDPLGRGYAAMTAEEKVASLTAADRSVLKWPTLSVAAMSPFLTDAEFAAVFDHVNFAYLVATLRAQDRLGSAAWIVAFNRRGLIGATALANCMAYVQNQVATPVSRATELGVAATVTASLLGAAGVA